MYVDSVDTIYSRDAMHGVSTLKIMYGYFRNGMHHIPIGNIPWKVHCTVTGRDAMHRVSTTNSNNLSTGMGTANDQNNPNSADKNSKQNQQENNTNSIDPIPSYVYYNRFGPQRKNLASIMRGFKSACTKQIRHTAEPNFYWQERYHDHIIRDNQTYWKIRNYIIHNPENWQDDRFFNT